MSWIRHSNWCFHCSDSREDIWLRTVPQCLKGPLGHEDTVTITCNTRYKGGVKWFKIDQESGDAVEVVTESTHLSRDYNVNGIYEKNLTLILTNVTRKRDSGTYVCWKSNGRDNARNVSIQILVQGKCSAATRPGNYTHPARSIKSVS